MEDYYAILRCDENSTLEEIKRNYQKLIREYHPDKGNNFLTTEYCKIDEAWKTLRDGDTRREYDRRRLNDRLNSQVLKYASLNKTDLDFDSEGGFYSYNCRCGGEYILTVENIGEDCIVSCNECSLFVEYCCK